MPRPPARLFLWILACFTLTACAGHSRGGGSLRALSLTAEPVALTFNASNACYAHDADHGTSFWLADAPFDELVSGEIASGQIVHVELLWIPKPGATPTNPEATNASIRWIVISNGEVGVYGGAGYASPNGRLGGKSAGLSIRQASLSLQWSTDGFRDLLTPAELNGGFSAPLDARKVRKTRLTVSQFVTDALGRSLFVQRSPTPNALDDYLNGCGS